MQAKKIHLHVKTIAISCIIILILLLLSPLLQVLNREIQNKYYGVKNSFIGLNSHTNILLVELDQKSLDAIGKYPFPRSVYGSVIENLTKHKVALTAFDFLFLDASIPAEDATLKNIIMQNRVVLWAGRDERWALQYPHSSITDNRSISWYLDPNVDASNKNVYSFTPMHAGAEHFTIKIIRQFYSYLYASQEYQKPGVYTWWDYIMSPDISLPLAGNNNKEILINYIPASSFTRVSFHEVYDAQKLENLAKNIKLKDKIVLIGPAADGFKDEFYTPNGLEYGMYIHANILNTILSKQFMMYFNKYIEWLLIFFLIIISVQVNLSRNSKTLVFWNLIIILVFWIIFPLSILLGTNLILNFPSEIILSLLLAFSASNIAKFLIEDANKRKLNSALSEYVSRDIAEEILEQEGKINLDGEKKHLVCFFSDIEGFTTMSEKLSPEELVTFLREYLWAMTDTIMNQEGHIDKYEWDAIMALWWAFSDHQDINYEKACHAALRQQNNLKELNKKWKEKFEKPVAVRMWIHGWEAIVWNIGAPGQKMEFTALGDNINLASRLEWVNKYYGSYICVSEEVYTATKNTFSYRYLDKIQVKWKDIPVKIYELRGYLSQMSDKDHELIEKFSDWVKLYNARKFSQAQKIFYALEWDAPSQTYLRRCETYIQAPPGDDWNGVWRMREK